MESSRPPAPAPRRARRCDVVSSAPRISTPGLRSARGPDDLGDVRVQQIDLALSEVAPQREPRHRVIHRFEIQHVDGVRREEAAGEKIAVAVLVRLPDAEETRRSRGEGGEPALDRPYRRLDTGPDRLALTPRQGEETAVGVDAERDVRRVLQLLVSEGVEQAVSRLETARREAEPVAGAPLDLARGVTQHARRSIVETLADDQQRRQEQHEGNGGGAHRRRASFRQAG